MILKHLNIVYNTFMKTDFYSLNEKDTEFIFYFF